ncbi:MAG TPA: type ISP restriction/modification enzyme, partial [Stenomitos sp.]
MSTAKIFYFTLQDEQTKEEKLDWFERTRFEDIPFDHITPDQKANWINLTDNDFDSLVPLLSKEVKLKRSQKAIFKFFTLGIKTDRDAWVYDYSGIALAKKVNYMIQAFEAVRQGEDVRNLDIKWDRNLDRYIKKGIKKEFSEGLIQDSIYRPFVKSKIYYDLHFNKETHQIPSVFSRKINESLMICFTDAGSQKKFMTIAIRNIPDFHLVGAAASAQCLPLYRYDENGNCIDNITDWALEQFRQHYQPSPPQPSSPAGEEGAEIGIAETGKIGAVHLPSPAGEGLGERAIANPLESIDPLVYLSGARRNIPEALLQRARALRQQQTPAEKILWECLRANRLNNAKFRRQHNIGPYIADFYCSAAKLVIELDGEIHQTQKDRDGDRNTWMQANGLTVLRFQNADITENLEQVLTTISVYLPSPPQPSSPMGEQGAGKGSDLPSPAGEGLGVRAITKLDIFHYTYAVLHHPAYRTKYELNL